eukprot:194245-Lingulodinium_polyedra.AAC.1
MHIALRHLLASALLKQSFATVTSTFFGIFSSETATALTFALGSTTDSLRPKSIAGAPDC